MKYFNGTSWSDIGTNGTNGTNGKDGVNIYSWIENEDKASVGNYDTIVFASGYGGEVL